MFSTRYSYPSPMNIFSQTPFPSPLMWYIMAKYEVHEQACVVKATTKRQQQQEERVTTPSQAKQNRRQLGSWKKNRPFSKMAAEN